MANEKLKLDEDGRVVAGAVTNDANEYIRNLRVDPITGRLLVDAAVSITDDTEHAEDSPFTNGDNGKLILAVRQDADTSPVSTDGDYTALITDNAGALKVNVKTSVLPTGAATGAKQDTGNTSVASIDTKTPALGQALAAASVPIVLTAAQLTTLTSTIPAAATAADGATNPTAPFVQAANSIFNGSTWDRMKEAANALNSTGGGIPNANIVGQFDDTSPTSITENSFGNVRISANRNLYSTLRDAAGNERGLNISAQNALLAEGGTAHGSSDAGNPLKMGLYATNANRTRVSNAQRTDAISDLAGRVIANLGAVRELRSKQTTTISASTSETTIGTAIASTFLDLVALVISNTSAAAARIDIRDTTAGTILFSIYVPAGDVRGFVLPGISIPQTTVNTNWTAQSSASVTDLRILAIFEKNI